MRLYKAAVVGASGYAGIEIVRILLTHPEFKLVAAASDSYSGQKLCDVYPALTGLTSMEFVSADASKIAKQCDVVFLAVPHTAAMACVPEFLQQGVAVIDLSADYRIHDQSVFEKWYGVQHTSAQLLGSAVYGQPEKNRAQLQALASNWNKSDNTTTPLVACAGCYPTASILASIPALEAGIEQGGYVTITALSGVSGAGKKNSDKTHYCNANESAQAYSAGKHRHAPEISQELTEAAGYNVDVVFTPVLAPLKRGILATVTMRIREGVTLEQILDIYAKRYAGESFVHFLGETMPKTSSVMGGNHAQIGISFEPVTRTLIVSSAIDNLDKGAASQAIQCANIIFGLNETAGLAFANPVV